MSNGAVPETVTFLKKRKSHHKIKEQIAIQRSAKDKAPKTKIVKFIRPHVLLANSIKRKLEEKRLLRIRKQGIKLQLNPGNHALLVVRTKTFDKVPPSIIEVFRALRLDHLNTAVFLKATKSNLALIQKIKPYVTFGEPSLKSVKNLIFKRGKTLVKGKPVALSSNMMVEEQLGSLGLICLEDIVHEISTVGKHFEASCNFLQPFQFTIDKKDSSIFKILISAVDHTTPEEKSEAINKLISKLN